MVTSTDVVALCADLVRFDTTNYSSGDAKGERAAAEYVAAHLAGCGLQPDLLEAQAGRSNVLVRIAGEDASLPALLMHAHLDVVPADAAEWSVPPFAGLVQDGFVWGRGALDIKGFAAQVLAVIAKWTETGERPARDVVLAFVADEESGGALGAHWLVDQHAGWFAGCTEAIGEFGGFSYPVNGVRLYPIATAERGMASMRLTATGTAGHASRRNPDNPVTRLAAAVTRLAEYEWPTQMTPAVASFIERAGKALDVTVDWHDIEATLARLGPAATMVESALRNSSTPTVLRAGSKVNVVPATATAEIDGRILPDGFDAFVETVDTLLGDGVTRELIATSAAVAAPIDTPLFEAMSRALIAEDPLAVPVPYCMGGGTDAKAFARLDIAGYGFTPLQLPPGFDYRSMAHGVDERVPIEGLQFGVRVLDRLLRGNV